MSAVTDSELITTYMRFVYDLPENRKTWVVTIYNKSNGVKLGTIKWFGRWRQYCLFPEGDTVFNRTCLRDVDSVILGLMAMRRA